MKKIISLLIILILTNCSSVSQFGAGVNITFDPRTIGMQIDDTIMQKNLSARLALKDKAAKKYWWRFVRPKTEMYQEIRKYKRILNKMFKKTNRLW